MFVEKVSVVALVTLPIELLIVFSLLAKKVNPLGIESTYMAMPRIIRIPKSRFMMFSIMWITSG